MDSESIPAARPRSAGPARNDTQDGILSYYQSEHAGQVYSPPLVIETTNIAPGAHNRQLSAASSPSEYSPDAEEEPDSKFFQTPATSTQARKQKSYSSFASKGLKRRSSIPSEGGMDERRLAIMDISLDDQKHGSTASSSATRSNSIRSRRGIQRPMDGLALVPPPDASLKMFTDLTPPSSAPLTVEKRYSDVPSRGILHYKSSSDIVTISHSVTPNSGSSNGGTSVHRRKSSRQVGIVGTDSGSTERRQALDGMRPPIFQLPQSRSPSPGTMDQRGISDTHGSLSLGELVKDGYRSTMDTIPSQLLVTTPNIGECKDVQKSVAGPIVVSITPSTPPASRSPRRSPSPSNGSARTSPPGAHSVSTAISPRSSYPSPPFTPEAPSPYLYYQPGVHAIAGPLPPPPRAAFNITPGTAPPPRPPRLNSPPPSGSRRRGDVGSIKQPLQVPDSIMGTLSGKTSSGSLSDVHSSSSRSIVSDRSEIIPPKSSPVSAASEELPSTTTIPTINSDHVREGAFPPSTESSPVVLTRQKEAMAELIADVGNAIDDVGLVNASEVPPPTVVEPSRPSEDPDMLNGSGIKGEDGWVGVTIEDIPLVRTPPSDEGVVMSTNSGHGPRKLFRRSSSRSPPKVLNEIGEEAYPSTSLKQRTGLGASLKRFSSLPRTPSRKAEKRLSGGSRSSYNSSVSTASTIPPPLPPLEVPAVPRTPPPIQKIISPWPSAMFYSEVLAKKTALERSLGYAAKINELYIYDCGLGNFLMERRTGGAQLRKRATLMPYGSRGLSTVSNTNQTRHPSRSSMESEVTFPRRADTTAATDLGYRPASDTSPPHGPPSLPYPSLAQPSPIKISQSSTSTSLSYASSVRFMSSSRSGKSSTGFFSSLGRKASGKAKESGDTAKLYKTSAKSFAPNPRPVNIPSTPTVPGGPRAVPNRVSRSQTIMLPKPTLSSASSHRSSSINQRPSLFANRRSSPDGGTSSESADNLKDDREFISQVNKLADLLPQADREVLAGYLRRAGSDLNAIGQYLEDEKNGLLRCD